jgi:hypothetical protein
LEITVLPAGLANLVFQEGMDKTAVKAWQVIMVKCYWDKLDLKEDKQKMVLWAEED